MLLAKGLGVLLLSFRFLALPLNHLLEILGLFALPTGVLPQPSRLFLYFVAVVLADP